MTSPSPTRRRTTRRWSIREPAGARPLLVAVALLAAAPAAAGWRDLQRTTPPPSAVAPLVSDAVPMPKVLAPVAGESAVEAFVTEEPCLEERGLE
ncbi:MAG: hypothetical protein ACR2IT_12845, partial [Pirellulales bacterium]